MSASPRNGAPFGRLLRLEAAARYLGVSPWLVRQYIQAGLLPTRKLPRPETPSALRSRNPVRLLLIDRNDLEAFVDAHGESVAHDVES